MAHILLAIGAVGHMILWVTIINRSHGLGIARKWINLMTLVCVFALPLVPLVIAEILIFPPEPQSLAARIVSVTVWSYVALCIGVVVWAIAERWRWLRHPERNVAPLSNHTARTSLSQHRKTFVSRGFPACLGHLPGNEVFDVHIQEKELIIPRLAAAHDGLRIAHVTDLHFSGRINREFFESVIEEVNAAAPDIVAVTGDLVEGDKFLDWIPSTLGRLRAKHGVYYVLGNHDRRATEPKLKATLAECGLIHVGGLWRQIMVNDAPLILAGNELPWYTPAADLSDCPAHDSTGGPMRVLLAHTPDQFRWAEANDVDLVLAGHLHGGQIRLPMLGAITSPSIHGVRYVAGLFSRGNTVLHVSRGVGSLMPVRYGCPPEVAVLVLRHR